MWIRIICIAMKIKELREKTENELKAALKENREKLRQMKFSLAANQLKNSREISKVKKNIAQILTLLQEKIPEGK
ncbi:MAG: 50S ribosomal protein L29 [Parcubacteria group bacterium GW2011_GWF2_39_13b]|nr:MAG: 50S ribosomal protein L29 [Parcubacteria group bacterium GW2011_GWF2_39_13b]